MALMPHDISTIVWHESFNCGRDTLADLVEVPWTGSSRPHLELGERWFDGIHVGHSDHGVHGRLFVDGQVVEQTRQCYVSSCGVRRGERVTADYAFQSVESAARFFRNYFFCCASASRTLSANDFSAFATIALNASVSMHVTQSGLTGSAGFNGRPRFCR